MPLSPKLVVMFVMHMSVMLLMLYYFYRYLVYFIVVLFAFASTAALVSCLEPAVNRINMGKSKMPSKFPSCFQTPMEVRQVALLAFALSVGLAWFLLRRNDTYGWILQDMLGIAFCLLSLLLSLLLIYDVFFVFVTPFLRANRESVMVEVAKGGSGHGDAAHGLLLSYCHAFDLLALGKRFYFYIASASYGLGMVATFAALELMHNAQPALLYLVPFTIIPTVTTAWYKGHLFAIWNGVKLPESYSRHQTKDESGNPTPRSSPGSRGVVAASSANEFIPDGGEGSEKGTAKQQKYRRQSKASEDQAGAGAGFSKNGRLPGQEGEPLQRGGCGASNVADGSDHATVAFLHRGDRDLELAASTIVVAPASATQDVQAPEGREQCPAACVVGAARYRWRLLQGCARTDGQDPSRLLLCPEGRNGFRRDRSDGLGPTTSPFPA
ncbi:hypothetical protein MTO96_017795 [Rhipicephalus appendiculatus]